MVHMLDNSPSLPSPFSLYLRSHCERPMNSSKRPRSPEAAEGYGDRPTKRPSLAVGEFNRRQLSHSSAASSRQGSEDWVQRAGGLTIDSPIYTSGDYPFLPQDDGIVGERQSVGQGEGDIDMAMESEEIEGRMEESQETVTPLSQMQMSTLDSHSSNSSHQQQSQQYQGETHAPHRHSYPTRYSERKQSSLINVVPVTPVHMLNSHQQYHIGASDDNSQLAYSKQDSVSASAPLSPTPMAISPTSSFSQLPTKRRVVFGPRANCEKCRLGIPGHFIHYE